MTTNNKLLNKNVQIKTGSHAKYDGKIEFMDEIGVMFNPANSKLNTTYIIWNNVRQITII